MTSVLIRRKGNTNAPWQPFATTPEQYAALFIATGLKAREIWDVKIVDSLDEDISQYSVNVIEAGELSPFAFTHEIRFAKIIRHLLIEDDFNLNVKIIDEVRGKIWKSE